MNIRRATAADGGAIAALQHRTWQATYRGVFPDDVLDGFNVAATTENWAAAATASRPDCAILVAERAGVVLGFASVAPAAGEPGVGELETLYVDPDLQRAGIGRALLAAATAELAAFGQPGALLWVAEANTGARRFYEAAGWACDGARKTWRGADVICYRRPLQGP